MPKRISHELREMIASCKRVFFLPQHKPYSTELSRLLKGAKYLGKHGLIPEEIIYEALEQTHAFLQSEIPYDEFRAFAKNKRQGPELGDQILGVYLLSITHAIIRLEGDLAPKAYQVGSIDKRAKHLVCRLGVFVSRTTGTEGAALFAESPSTPR